MRPLEQLKEGEANQREVGAKQLALLQQAFAQLAMLLPRAEGDDGSQAQMIASQAAQQLVVTLAAFVNAASFSAQAELAERVDRLEGFLMTTSQRNGLTQARYAVLTRNRRITKAASAALDSGDWSQFEEEVNGLVAAAVERATAKSGEIDSSGEAASPGGAAGGNDAGG